MVAAQHGSLLFQHRSRSFLERAASLIGIACVAFPGW
jgi:hypothetical protein